MWLPDISGKGIDGAVALQMVDGTHDKWWVGIHSVITNTVTVWWGSNKNTSKQTSCKISTYVEYKNLVDSKLAKGYKLANIATCNVSGDYCWKAPAGATPESIPSPKNARKPHPIFTQDILKVCKAPTSSVGEWDF